MARHARRHPTPRALLRGGVALGAALGCGLVALAAVPLPTAPPALAVRLPEVREVRTLVLPFPSAGEAAVGIPLFSMTAASPDERVVPIASLTKLMLAYVTLARLPLHGDETGPSWVVSDADAAVYRDDVRTDQSSVRVVPGEVLDERQLLEGALIHSASNYADMLGELVAGTDDAMVAQMNAMAGTLGMRHTSYADVSGFDPKSVSTASDQLRLATLLMRNATFAGIVAQGSVELPVAGLVGSYTPELGRGGVVGVKSGFTSQAGGCDVMAREFGVGGVHVLVLAVVLGQTSSRVDALAAAGTVNLMLTAALASHLYGDLVTLAHHPVGTLGWPGHGVALVATSTIRVPSFDLSPPRVVVTRLARDRNGVRGGSAVARVEVTSGGLRASTLLVAASALTRSSLWQRLR